MKFTLTIKDNESGEILQNHECNAIIGGVSLGNPDAASIIVTSCTGKELFSAYKATQKSMNKVVEDNPILLLADLFGKLNEKEDTEND